MFFVRLRMFFCHPLCNGHGNMCAALNCICKSFYSCFTCNVWMGSLMSNRVTNETSLLQAPPLFSTQKVGKILPSNLKEIVLSFLPCGFIHHLQENDSQIHIPDSDLPPELCLNHSPSFQTSAPPWPANTSNSCA